MHATAEKKTPVLFAFGHHPWGALHGDTRFFRRSVVPFAKNQLNQGRRVAIIAEMTTYLSRYDKDYYSHKLEQKGLNPEQAMRAWAAVQEIVMQHNILRTDPVIHKPWGFEKAVVKLNQNGAGIELTVEPNLISTVYLLHVPALLNPPDIKQLRHKSYSEQLDEMVTYLRAWIAAHVSRDRNVAQKANDLASEDPDRAIIIPRGYGHRGMVCLFDETRYSITIKERSFPMDFIYDAMALSYTKELNQSELEQFAKLQLNFLRLNAPLFKLLEAYARPYYIMSNSAMLLYSFLIDGMMSAAHSISRAYSQFHRQ